MDVWEILGISKTTNIKEIKQAYARRAKEIHLEEQPKEFQRLYDSYQKQYKSLISSATFYFSCSIFEQLSHLSIASNNEDFIMLLLLIFIIYGTYYGMRIKRRQEKRLQYC